MSDRGLLLILIVLTLSPAARSAEQAAALLDLETFALPKGAELSGHRRAASLSYQTAAAAEQAFKFVADKIKPMGWEELPGATHSHGFASAYFKRDGFLIYVSASPAGLLGTHLSVTHQGNVAPSALPMPPNAKQAYDFPGVMMLTSPDDPATAAKGVREAMLAAGWTPYGGAADSAYFRKNAVQADVTVQSAPAQGGATMISCSTHLLSLELPAPGFADDFRYTDGASDISFDCDKTAQEVADFYQDALAPAGWRATTEKPVPIKWKLVTIFRNDQQEMITLATHNFEGHTRARLDHMNAAEVAEQEFLDAMEAGRVATYREGMHPEVPLKAAALAGVAQPKPWGLRGRAADGDAFAAAEAIVQELTSAGWSVNRPARDTPVLRDWALTKNDHRIHVLAARPPKADAWVGVVGIGVTFSHAGAPTP